MTIRHAVSLLVVCGALGIPAMPVVALDGLEQLQAAARQDQATECMIHEYARRYNEVLRDDSKRRRTLTADMEDAAHREAIQWVRDVWKYADQRTVARNMSSGQFRSTVSAFRAAQHSQYPNLHVVP